MPDLEKTILLFVAAFVGWTIAAFSGGATGIILLAAVNHLILVTTIVRVIHQCQSDGLPYKYFGLVETYRVVGRPLVSPTN